MSDEDPRPLRVLLRTCDGRLRDPADGDVVGLEEFRARLQAGERLRVRHERTGADCTLDTVAQVITACLPHRGARLADLQGLFEDGPST
ncbi:hypothetical protein G3I40_02575 [Streptomyces sp. SID14478]|uniref:hypothetical protein n=1 Tax=Streptomyces sp. SID14478 TaxID=2706073 RepID=UPI0013DC860D|nr:hypothetical protein [Streptomyces sp. SID14478]NEB74129.1 hypothetical protein [Streptomyces sp. SID14478]